MQEDLSLFLKAVSFSADKHRDQRRKGESASPYVNHPIEVANVLWTVGEVHDVITIVGALLHDTIEDTATTEEEIRASFGPDVLALVLEVSDDKTLPNQERKQKQITKAPFLSHRAKQLKLADKTCNIKDIANFPPQNWSWQRKMQYLEWAAAVVTGLRGVNSALEKNFDEALAAAHKKMAQEKNKQTG
jgi:GTP diphosphokinase / guanosine-3',5'-bis(diphosphate) 3'-diphosphatase